MFHIRIMQMRQSTSMQDSVEKGGLLWVGLVCFLGWEFCLNVLGVHIRSEFVGRRTMAGNLRHKFKLFKMFNLNQFHFKFAMKTFLLPPTQKYIGTCC